MRLGALTLEHYGQAWEWLNQFPEANFDDTGPRTYEAFLQDLVLRRARGELLWTVEHEDRPVGLIGVAFLSHRAATFHGICLDRSVHGQGVARAAVRVALELLFGAGIEKVSAGYFADNERIHRLFQKLGAREEGCLRRQTTRAGVPVDMRLAAFFKGD